MKSHLSHILPVWKACDILGYETVYRIVHSYIRLKESISNNGGGHNGSSSVNRPVPTTTTSDDDIKVLCNALCYQPPDSDDTQTIPDSIINAWKKWVSHPLLVIDNKSTFIQFVVPSTVQPHPGPTGHMGLFDCWVYALQGHAAQNMNPANTISNNSYYSSSSASGSSNNQPPTIWIPDVIILFAISKDYQDFRLRQKRKIVEYRRRKHQEHHEKLLQQESINKSKNSLDDGNDNEDDKVVRKTNEADNEELMLSPSDRKIIWKMATLSYRIYDSYQKKGILQLDTIHRFLTDVYGEESFKQPKNKALLELIFYLPQGNDVRNDSAQNTTNTQHPTNNQYLQATVSEQQFSKRTLDTVRIDDIYTTHILLDWISLLACSMMPLEKIPASISNYLDTLQLHDVAKSQASICQLYNLAENRLYEIKRKFHSMVAKSNSSNFSIIQGHPMTSATDANDNNGNGSTLSAQGTAASPETEYQPNSGGSTSHKVISGRYFVQSLSTCNEEVGSGGYLPPILAMLVFHAGCTPTGTNNQILLYNSHTSSHGVISDQLDSTNGWGLHNVLQFGCVAVRHNNSKPQDPDVPLLRFLFSMFQLSSPHIYSDFNPIIADKKVLTRAQVTTMIELLVDYAVYRRRADGPPIELDDTENEDNKEDDDDNWSEQQQQQILSLQSNSFDLESYETNTVKDLTACALLGLIPPTYKVNATNSHSKRNRKTVTLKLLVDYALDGNTLTKDQMTFEEFVTWHSTKMTETGPRTRLGPLMTEIRLIAAVQFGIPPVLASMEITLVAEIERRHKLRYPQTDVSRRGPRGTVWYIIDALWFTSWANLVKKTAGTPLDSHDGRGGINNPDRSRTMNRIRNASLLVDNGSLALRPDIRWKHDYEILPPLAWSALQAWYDGGPPIYRSVVKYVPISSPSSPHSNQASNIMRGQLPTEYEIELYPLFVTVYLCDSASRGEAKPFQQHLQLSRVSAIMVMLVQLCKELDVNPDQARLWVMNRYDPSDPNATAPQSSSANVDESGKMSFASAGIDDWILGLDQSIIEQLKRRGSNVTKDASIVLLLEIKDRDTGLWPRGIDGTEWAFQREKNATLSSSTHNAGGGPSDLGDGIVGLYNMGNTCYLNSSVQCLSHTPIFREYFTSKAYLNDINTTNPLGYEGRLAQVTSMLINSLWKRFNNQANDPTSHQKRVTAPGSYALVTAPALTPKTFKESLSKFNEHFQGNEQHDAQELLAFLLGGLSEDLNRIVNKPYIEAPDSDGRPDKELADIWWSNHLKREMSIIVALFTGQYKSLLTCRSCKYESARFEPFSFLQIPLPEDDNLTVTLLLYPIKENECAIKYCVRVRNDGKLRDVLIALAKVLYQDETDEKTNTNVGGLETSDSNEEDNIYVERIQNLAVVDMRDGYISKIAPNSWLLQDLQNRETGELPLLHVFELDPIPIIDALKGNGISPPCTTETQEDVPMGEIEGGEGAKKPELVKPKQAYLAIGQRRSELMSINYLHPLVHRVFGTPVLLRVHDLDNCTGRHLYDIVAKRLKNVVHRSVHRFLSPKESKKEGSIDEASADVQLSSASTTVSIEDEGRAFRDVSASVYRTLTDTEEVSAGPTPRYGFRLRITSRDGRRCLSCPWYESCIGCLVPDDDKPTVVMDGDSAVVDWHFAVDVATNGFGLRSNMTDIGQSNSRLPRNTSTVTIRNHTSCGTGVNAQNMLQQPGAVTLEECLDAFAKEEKIPEAYCSKCKDFRIQTKRMSLWRLPPVMIIHLKRFQFTQHMRRKLRDLVVFPIEGLDLSRIMASATDAAAAAKKKNRKGKGPANEDNVGEESHESNDDDALKDDGRSEMLYDLYGVVHHQGALSGGHYVASLKSELDGQFRLFNDAQIYEIHARDVVDPSAYILFYIRRDVAKAKLTDFWNVKEAGHGMSEEDMDQLLKGKSDRCVIS